MRISDWSSDVCSSDLLDLVAQVDAHLGVERGQRLVEQQQARRGGDGAGERDALLLAARELRRVLAALIVEADEVEQLGDAAGDLGARAAAVFESEGDVALDRQVGDRKSTRLNSSH